MIYRIDFFSDWHSGSGLSAGADMDLLVVKDDIGFPFVPGKVLKGLLRESAETLMAFCDDVKQQENWARMIKDCFGARNDMTAANKEDRGKYHFSNAELTQELKKQLSSNNTVQMLFRKQSSTAIDNAGQAENHSLRSIEVVVPLVLFAEITDLPEEYRSQIEMCLQWIKRLGSDRNHGLGRCRLSVHASSPASGGQNAK